MPTSIDNSAPLKLLKTIYLGDRGITGISMDTDNGIIKIHIDCISRIRGKHWDHYTDEDLENGAIA